MSNELTKSEFEKRIKERTNYLYKVEVLATPNDHYVDYAYEYIMQNEIDGNMLKGISTITRASGYNVNHRGKTCASDVRVEEGIVLDMFNKNTDKNKVFGTLQGYQIPLKNTNADKGIGKIDFAFVKNNAFTLAEIKSEYSGESLLKAILEIQTYYQVVDKKKLLESFNHPTDMKIKKCIVIYKNTKAHKQFLSNQKLLALIKLFDIEVLVLRSQQSFIQLA